LASLTTPGVPFLDLRPSHDPLRELILADVAALLESSAFTNGPAVAQFEAAFAAYCHARRCVGMGSGLDALRLALLALGVERGDEVIVPAQTFVATYEAVTQAGCVPVVADVGTADYNLDVAAAEAAITPRTRAIMPVHLYGQLADMRALRELADRRGLLIVEDACQAHGASRDGLHAGEAAEAAAFSFYPGKNLGALGDAGALTTSDDAVADRCVALREHGQTEKYRHAYEGYTSRLDTIQAAVLLRKLELLDSWNEERRRAAAVYGELLAGVGDLVLPPVPEGSRPVWHLYPVCTEQTVELAHHLRENGIGTGRHYPQPPHLSDAYSWLGHRPGSFPVAERLAERNLTLPIFPGIDDEQLEFVAATIKRFFDAV
jgi:dTDP-4-amino-4,6-dideoxygalactose transaminase